MRIASALNKKLVYSALLVLLVVPLHSQNDWPSYGSDPGHMKYSPLTQITPQNVSTLAVAWTYHTGNKGVGEWEDTPLVVGGVMYAESGDQRVIALEPETGKEIWIFTPNPPVARPRESRGVSYWPGDKDHAPRIVYGTSDGRLIAIDAKTGQSVTSFGRGGYVDLRVGVGEDYPNSGVSVSSPPAIYKNLAIIGNELQESPRVGPRGTCRAYDIITGKLAWRFNGAPVEPEFGYQTWENGAWKDQGGPSLWAPISVDVERGMVFAAWGQPGYAFDGSQRRGSNLFASSVTAHDANTGRLLWYCQTVHHDIFDADLCHAPLLIDITLKRVSETGDKLSAKVPVVIQGTKGGAVFILDRLTGQPIFGAEEVPVPQSDLVGRRIVGGGRGAAGAGGAAAGAGGRAAGGSGAAAAGAGGAAAGAGGRAAQAPPPAGFSTGNTASKSVTLVVDEALPGEQSWPTQPRPIKPPLLGRTHVHMDDLANELANLSPQSRKYCEDFAKTLTNTGWMQPVTEKLQLRFPGNIGGINWGGITGDPRSGIIYVNTYDLGWASRPEANPGRGPRFIDESGYPCQKPPWGQLHAINANTGDILWQVPLGSFKELEEKGIRDTGAPNLGAPTATASGLLFIAATNDKRFRAFDAKTGKLLWVTDLEATGDCTPSTYMGKDGRQYVVVSTGGAVHLREGSPYKGEDRGDSIVAFALPAPAVR